MIEWIQEPKDETVAKYVEAYWFLNSESTKDYKDTVRLNPEPSAHLLVCDKRQPYEYDISENSFSGVGTHWLFPQTKTISFKYLATNRIVGIKFRIGAPYSLPGMSNKSAINQVSEGKLIQNMQSSAFMESEIIKSAVDDPEKCCTFLDKVLKPWLNHCANDKHTMLVNRLVQFLPDHAIGDLESKVFATTRTIERSFLRVTGFTLRQCQSMIKLEALLQHLQPLKKEDIDWASIAFEFGFSDQPHLIRYIKNQLGKCPGKYAAERDLAVDRFGGVELLKSI